MHNKHNSTVVFISISITYTCMNDDDHVSAPLTAINELLCYASKQQLHTNVSTTQRAREREADKE